MADTEIVEHLLAQLPDPRAAQRLYGQLLTQSPIRLLFQRDPALLSDVLALAAWSPLLTTTLENNPEYVSWLQRERIVTRVRTSEELSESLGRFALINSQLNPHVMLARFRRRELLRTYLHDIRRSRTVVETTEELSVLADATLEYALKLARQELDNLYGAPQIVDSHGRISHAEFCVVALGKLGSYELNYASDIDLLFLFSEDGTTAVNGSRGQISNREYFVKVGERLLRIVSEQTGEGASYRIDMRLRPHGRDGALAVSLAEAVRYYRETAQDWELQALIRSRASAGSAELFSEFIEQVTNRVFRPDVSVTDALASVRKAKEKIDRERPREQRGYNVKLGRGGIREIEFIAQALQVAFGGRDAWLRAPHTLISLGRLTDRSLITETEYQQLSDAYNFLRAVEHRLQMEHGLQTHSVPADDTRRELLARRMSFAGSDALLDFDAALDATTSNVHSAFERIFGKGQSRIPPVPRVAVIDKSSADTYAASLRLLAQIFSKHGNFNSDEGRISDLVQEAARRALNPHRAIACAARVVASLDKGTAPFTVTEAGLRALVQVCGGSEFFSEMLASSTSLLEVLDSSERPLAFDSSLLTLKDQIVAEKNFAAQLDALRRWWSRSFVDIGARDAQMKLTLGEVNQLLNQLAIASLDAALLIAREELRRRYTSLTSEPRMSVFGLGRLGSGGMDYGSDLDVVLVYDSQQPAPVAGLTHAAAYARLAEFFVSALSSITREGYLYRVDLRLRPDGQKGALAVGSRSFLAYLRTRAAIWEWLAYVKLRAVAGDAQFGRTLEAEARTQVHEMARAVEPAQLRAEARRVRERLEREKTSRRGGINIKHGPGGMLDVYFAARYLQLRDDVKDDGEDRTTLRTLRQLREAGSLDENDYEALVKGYELLRAVDHQLRLIVGRSATLPATEQPAYGDISRRLDFPDAQTLTATLTRRMSEIRAAYDRIMRGG